VLKNPSHLFALDALLRVYPDADPIAAAESVYARFGLPLTGAAADAMRAASSPAAAAGPGTGHRFSLADFGLTEHQVDERFVPA
jgi:hypothetical protein